MAPTVGNGREGVARSTSASGVWVVVLMIAAELVLGGTAGNAAGHRRGAERCDPKIMECEPTSMVSRSSGPAFGSGSYWNTPLPANAPVDPDSDEMIAFIAADSTSGRIRLAGTGSTGAWGTPIYTANGRDPAYAVVNSCQQQQPPELGALHIPDGARPDPTSDAAMTVYDMAQGIVVGLWRAAYDPTTRRWSACGGSVYYLASNGLAGELPQSDDPRNRGHRGVPPSAYAVRSAEIDLGSIDHVLKIAVDTTACSHVFPMVGDECGTTASHAPPEGTRIRIDPAIDLRTLKLSPAALVIARALQRFGAVIADQSGGPVALKVENTIAEGRGWLWRGVLDRDSLAPIPWSAFEVVELGYQP